jgi:hypothetical protein
LLVQLYPLQGNKKGGNTLKKHRMFVEIRGTGKITILGIDTQVLH